MKRDQLWKHLVIVFVVSLIVYILGFSWLEHRRHRSGPWEVTFIKEPASAPMIVINQPALQITNVRIEFTGASDAAPTNSTVDFVAGRAVPFPVPFGQCVFLDPLFLPGTVTLKLFDRQIEILPRTLTIDGQKHPWKSETNIGLSTDR